MDHDATEFFAVPFALEQELAHWATAGMKARVWLRDDDACSDTPHLRRLIALARELGTVIALAVIPERVDGSLVKLVAKAPVCIWQHGWRHHWDHDGDGAPYSQGEFGPGRLHETMMADAEAGQRALDRRFGAEGWQKVFVPPFHALSVPFKLLLPSLGYWGLSTGEPLSPAFRTLKEINTETDIMNWRRRCFAGAEAVAASLVGQLRARRLGEAGDKTPVGLLTHHLAHDKEAWRFLTGLLRWLKANDAVDFVAADKLFSAPQPASAGTTTEITVVVTSCGRQDLLERTLDSFLAQNSYPVSEFVVIEDGDGALNEPLAAKYRAHPFVWMATGRRLGQVAAIDAAYAAVKTELVFHCEDDWEFMAPGFIEKSLAVMEANPSILQVWLRGLKDTNKHPAVKHDLKANGVAYRLMRHHHKAGAWGAWNGFSWNPGVRRMRDYLLLGSFSSFDPDSSRATWLVESDAGIFYQKLGFHAAILTDNDGTGYVRHTGGERRVERDYVLAESGDASSPLPASSAKEGAERAEPGPAPIAAAGHGLAGRLVLEPRFEALPRHCVIKGGAGFNEVPEWRNWADLHTTAGQLRIEAKLEDMVSASTSILDIGIGNSSLAKRFASRIARIVGTTISKEEAEFAQSLGLPNYDVRLANKFTSDMDEIQGSFDFIVDSGPIGFSCCLPHFAQMMNSHARLLRPSGGLFLTERKGLSWVCHGNDPGWSFNWEDWKLVAKLCAMDAVQVTDEVFGMKHRGAGGSRPAAPML